MIVEPKLGGLTKRPWPIAACSPVRRVDMSDFSTDLEDAVPGIDFNPEALREKYREDRDRRIRADGNEKYVEVEGDFTRYVDDPSVAPVFPREPLHESVEVLIV